MVVGLQVRWFSLAEPRFTTGYFLTSLRLAAPSKARGKRLIHGIGFSLLLRRHKTIKPRTLPMSSQFVQRVGGRIFSGVE